MKKLIPLIILIAVLFSCKEEPTTPIDNSSRVVNTIKLTEDWTNLRSIQIKFTPSENDQAHTYSYHLLINGTETEIYNSLLKDTTYTHKGLTEGTPYSYKIKAYEETELKDTSKTLRVNTLAVTSNDFTWKIDTLGQSGNFLRDIWGIDENNVWAVGAVELPEGKSGFIKWDGIKWTPLPSFAGTKTGIFGFDQNSIVVVGQYGDYGVVGRWNGNSWEETNFLHEPLSGDTVWALNAVWGSSPEDVWAVGNGGTIIHYDGSDWSKVENTIPGNLFDVWGSDKENIFAIAYSPGFSKIIHYDGTLWEDYTEKLSSANNSLISVWIDKTKEGYTFGGSLYSINDQTINKINFEKTDFIEKVRGNRINNVFAVGESWGVYHNNGSGWYRYEELSKDAPYDELLGVQVFEKNVFIVGHTTKNVIIIRGTR